VGAVDDAVHNQAGCLLSLGDFFGRGSARAVEFDAIKAQFLQQLKLVGQRALNAHHANLHRFAKTLFRLCGADKVGAKHGNGS
jgi:hypothetical protein